MMATATHCIKQLRRLKPPKHTASKTKRTLPHFIRGGARECAYRKWYLPYGIGLTFCGLLNVLKLRAADFAVARKVCRSFFSFRHSVGCRSPPLLKF